jgi:carboxyl-terminal processing protease
MPWDTVQMLDYERWKGMPLSELEAKSHTRVVASPYFQEMNGFLKQEEVIRKRKYVPLSLSAYVAERARNRAESDTLEALQKKATDLSVDPLPTGTDVTAADSAEKEKVKSWKEQLSRDFYLREAVNITDDWVNKKK